MKKIFFTILIFSLFLTNSGAKAGKALVDLADHKANSDDLELIDQFGLTNPLGMITSRNLAFVGQQAGKDSEVVIIDLTDPEQLAVLAVISIAPEVVLPDIEAAYPLAVISNTLYVGVPILESTVWEGTPGIKLFDISDATNPTLIGEFSLGYEYPVKMEISGNYAYLLDKNGGIEVLDVSNPASPSLVGKFEDGPYPYSKYSAFDIQGKYAYTVNGYLMIYDLSNPSSPTLVSTYQPVDGRGLEDSITVEGNYAYAYANSIYSVPAMKVFDISNPVHPKLLTEMPLDLILFKQLITSGGLLFGVFRDGLQIYDIGDPMTPQLLATYTGIEGVTAQPQEDTIAYLDMIGFQMLDVSDPAHPSRLGIRAWPQASSFPLGSGNYIAAAGTNLFTVRNTEAGAFLQVIDIGTPGAPQVTNVIPIDSGIRGEMIISDSTLYIPTEKGMVVIDITDPSDLQTHSMEFLDSAWGSTSTLDVQSETAVVLSKPGEWYVYQGVLSIIDVTNPFSPVLIGSFHLDEDAYDVSVEIQGTAMIAYITTETGWLVLDISTPTAPTVLFRDTSIPVEAGRPILIDTATLNGQTMAYLAKPGDPGELVAIDVSDPTNPVARGSFSTTWAPPTFLSVERTLVYFGTWADWVDWESKAVILVDFEEPEKPIWFGTAAFRDWFVHASLSDDYLVVVSSTDVYIFANRGWLEGRVTDHNIVPIEGVTLTLSTGAVTLSDMDGLYSFPDLEFGSYTITPTLTGYAFAPSWAMEKDFFSGWQSFIILASPASITLEAGVTTTLTYTDVQGLPTSFTFPPGLVDAPATAVVTPTLADGFFGMRFAGHAFELALLEGGEPVYSTTFPAPVSVTIQYSPLDAAVITDTLMLALYRQDGAAWVKTDGTCPAGPAPLPIEPGIFRATICQSGHYALLGPTHAIALPQVSYGSDTGEVILPLTH